MQTKKFEPCLFEIFYFMPEHVCILMEIKHYESIMKIRIRVFCNELISQTTTDILKKKMHGQ